MPPMSTLDQRIPGTHLPGYVKRYIGVAKVPEKEVDIEVLELLLEGLRASATPAAGRDHTMSNEGEESPC